MPFNVSSSFVFGIAADAGPANWEAGPVLKASLMATPASAPRAEGGSEDIHRFKRAGLGGSL